LPGRSSPCTRIASPIPAEQRTDIGRRGQKSKKKVAAIFASHPFFKLSFKEWMAWLQLRGSSRNAAIIARSMSSFTVTRALLDFHLARNHHVITRIDFLYLRIFITISGL